MLNKLYYNNKRFLSYSFFGGAGVLSDVSVYALLINFDVNYQIANAIGYFFGTLLSFFLNRKYTFKIEDNVYKRLMLFFLVAFLGYLSSAILLYVFVVIFSIDVIFSKILTLFFVLLIQFTLNKKITFKESV